MASPPHPHHANEASLAHPLPPGERAARPEIEVPRTLMEQFPAARFWQPIVPEAIGPSPSMAGLRARHAVALWSMAWEGVMSSASG